MKKKQIVLAGFVILFSIANFYFGTKTPETSSDLTLENIDAVKASASETTCKGPGDPCKIYEDGKLVGEGHGDLTHIN